MMARLEDLAPGAVIEGVVADERVSVVNVRWYGQAAVELTYKVVQSGEVGHVLLYRTDEERLRVVEEQRQAVFDGDGTLFRLAAEAKRIRLAYLFDPRLAVHISQVEALPHQIAAVYEEMLRRQPLRYLLADDPGAGKTIMAGLLIKELMLRGDLERCLVVCPANLGEQWQDELRDKFKLRFDIVGHLDIEGAASGNPFVEKPLVISRMDLLKRDENQERLGHAEWDLVVVDEAHKMSASFTGGDVKRTARYELGELLCSPARARHVLFLTATPHRGKEEDFQLFLALLDRDRFEGKPREDHQPVDAGDIMRRMLKEELVDFDGKPLFPERRAYSVNYPLSEPEEKLYNRVTEYVRTEMSRADQLGREGGEGAQRSTVVGFALTVLQRRLASSPEAIYQSLRRRRERLENRLRETLRSRELAPLSGVAERLRGVDEDDVDDLPSEEREEIEEQVLDEASAARTVKELSEEIETLKGLEEVGQEVRKSGVDRKWEELEKLLTGRAEMFDRQGNRLKLIIFTEHRDTLTYLANKIRNRLADQRAVVEIHGGLNRKERQTRQSEFLNNPSVLVLVATDAAGEGVNLQRAHLMVNYDLPWNPNRIEQRFGRIHRFGQKEVCHLWNLVAYQTREGAVFKRLLDKLDTERQALGGKVFDVLGQVFEGAPLRDLLLEAIRYGDQPEVKARLEQRIDALMSPERYRKLIEEYALAKSSMDTAKLQSIREEMERAEARRLQPHFIASFFLECFSRLGGSAREREPRRYEVLRVPQEIARRVRQFGRGAALPARYERIVFEKERVNVKDKPSPAEFVAPGHPLLESTVDFVLERYGELLLRGAVLVDPRDDASDAERVLFMVEHEIRDGRTDKHGNHRLASRQLQFVEIGEDGTAMSAGSAPYLDYRPLADEERKAVEKLLRSPWLSSGIEERAKAHAIEHLVPQHLQEVKSYREELVLKTMAAVKDRLTKEIQYWDSRAEQLKLEELAGKQPRMNSAQARRRADDLTTRLQNRMRELEQERQLAPMPPIVTGSALVVPERLLAQLVHKPQPTPTGGDRAATEELAVQAVMREEQRLGRIPRRVDDQNLGYDIESRDAQTGRLHFIEVKGRYADADSIHVTKNEWLVALNKREMYVLAVVLVRDRAAEGAPHYVRDPMAKAVAGDLTFGITGVDLSVSELFRLEAKESRE